MLTIIYTEEFFLSKEEAKNKCQKVYLLHMIGLVSLSESPAALIEPWVSVKYELRREKKREEDEMEDRRGEGGGRRRRRERRKR